MRKSTKRFIASLICCLIVGTVFFVSAVLSTDTKLVINGIRLTGNGETIQAFIDVSIKDVDASSVAFCIKYDKSLLALSNADTNEVVNTPSTGYDTKHKYFKQNTEAFPELDTFLDNGLLGQADPTNGYLAMYFVPKCPSSSDEDSNIGVVEVDGEERGIIKAAGKTLKLGDISFLVSRPAELAKLSEDELKKVIEIVPFDDVEGIYSPVDSEAEDNGVYITYFDEDGDIQFYSANETKIEITADLRSVTMDAPEMTVSALDVYSDGSQNDMISYLNSYMSDLTLEYADGTKVVDSFLWDNTAEGFEVDKEWNVKGSDYTITQKYNDKFSVTAKLHVTPVKLEEVYVDDQSLTYSAGGEVPQTLGELLPDKAQTVLNPSSVSKGLDIKISDWYYQAASSAKLETPPESFLNKEPDSYTFVSAISSKDIDEAAPWITNSKNYDIQVTRTISESESDIPASLTARAEHTANHGLKITAQYENGQEIPQDTEFIIRMQDGSILDVENLGEKYQVSIEEGIAYIYIDNLDLDDEYQKTIAQKLNLGDKIGPLKISVKEQGESAGSYTKFSCPASDNFYIRPESGTYEFDYSELSALMFPISRTAEGKLSQTITLPGTDRVNTTYSGYDGSEPGSLKTITVDGWDVTESNGIAVAVGKLSNTAYSNYGYVGNSSDVNVKIKFKASADETEEKIKPIDDFEFDMLKQGYGFDELQNAVFTIENIGNCDINGLSVQIGTDDNNTECFTLVNPPASILKKDNTVDFSISTKKGLSIGEHKSKVKIISNQSQTVLESFDIRFVVTRDDVYKITINSSDENFGTAKVVSETYTAVVGDTVEIIAQPIEGCKFTGWTAADEEGNEIDLDFGDASQAETDFTMPRYNVVITAAFEEGSEAYLRLDELSVQNTDNTENALKDNEWKTIEFSPVVREYYVAVPSNTDKNKLVFKPREEGSDANITVVYKNDENDEGTEITSSKDDEGQYTTDEFELEKAPAKNILVITMSAEDEDHNPIELSYTIYICKKLAIKDMIAFQNGNSPYGMIEKMKDVGDTPWTEEQIKEAEEKFKDNNYKFDASYTPVGGNSSVSYTPDAWTNENYDLDSSAVFIIQGEDGVDFTDPGWTKMTNSLGTPVERAGLSRSVTVKALKDDKEEEWGTSSDFSNVEDTELVFEGDILRSEERIRPDVYELKYTFKDYDGENLSIIRNIIIIPQLGDVNADGKIDNKDSDKIYNRFSEGLPYKSVEGYTGGAIYRYRVCDANKDRNINAIDANAIRAKRAVQFYK